MAQITWQIITKFTEIIISSIPIAVIESNDKSEGIASIWLVLWEVYLETPSRNKEKNAVPQIVPYGKDHSCVWMRKDLKSGPLLA